MTHTAVNLFGFLEKKIQFNLDLGQTCFEASRQSQCKNVKATTAECNMVRLCVSKHKGPLWYVIQLSHWRRIEILRISDGVKFSRMVYVRIKAIETSAQVFGRRKLIFRGEVKLIFQKLTITPWFRKLRTFHFSANLLRHNFT